MTKTSAAPAKAPARPAPSRSSRVPWAIAGAAAALAVALGVSRWTSEPDATTRRRPARERPAAYGSEVGETPSRSRPASARAAFQAAVAAAPEAAPAPSSRAAVPAAHLAHYQAEVVSRVEQQRPEVVSSCWPREGLPRGQRSATVTYNVTFDPSGREVARGIVQDRRAPAGQFGKCLAQLQTTPFSISAPGRYVTLRVPVAYP
jgi:hypothetical protein